MSEGRLLDRPEVENVLKFSYLPHLIFLGLVALSLVGDLLSDHFPRESHLYWFMMVPIFGFAAFTVEAALIKKMHLEGKKMLRIQVIHWGGTLLAVLTIFFLNSKGHLTSEDTGLVIHIILALSTFLVGLHLGWKFYLLGILLFLLAGFAGFDPRFLTTLLGFIVPIIFLGIYLEDSSTLQPIKKQ